MTKIEYRLEELSGTEIDTFTTRQQAQEIKTEMENMGMENLRIVPTKAN